MSSAYLEFPLGQSQASAKERVKHYFGAGKSLITPHSKLTVRGKMLERTFCQVY